MPSIAYTVQREGAPAETGTVSGTVIKIGRNGQLRLADSTVDRIHALVEFAPDGAVILDMGSSSGTFLNGKRINKSKVERGDRIQVGASVIEVTGLDFGHGPRTRDGAGGSPPRYCSVRILDKCPHCGAGLPMNGLLMTVHCGNCQKDTNLRPEYWKSVLEDPDNDHAQGGGSHTLNFETSVTWRAEAPRCAKCNGALPVDRVEVGTDGSIECPVCQHANTTYPAPVAVSDLLPSIRQVYCGEREGGDGGQAVVERDAEKPVILSCPQCKGSLKITARSDRMVPCEYCGADVYLPDDLWKRLHPVKTASDWYVRYEGKSQSQIERDREMAEEQARWRRDELEFQKKQFRRRKLRPAHLWWTLFGAFIATVVIGAILPIFAGGGDPLFGLAGKILCPDACDGCEGPLVTESWTTQTSDGTSTQFDFYCEPPGASHEDRVQVTDGAVILTTFVVLFPACLVLAGVVLVFVRLSRR